jgi:GxxExxY protein
MTDLLFKEEVYQIIGAAMEVYNEMGCLPEPICQESMEIELDRRRIPFKPQHEISLYYKGQKLKKHFAVDFLGYDKIIVELKSMENLTDRERGHLLNYLKSSDYELGLLINFGSEHKLEWERIVWSKQRRSIQHGF